MVLSRLTKITGPGVATDTNWVGNNADFTGITTSATSFNIGVTTIHSNLIEAHNIKSTGIITATGAHFSGNVTAVDGTFSGNVSIAGTLTYEDVTNIDSVGIITAPAVDIDDFLDVGSSIKLGNAGVITATSFVGSGAALTGIDATAIKDSGGNVKIQAQASGAVYTGIHTFSSGAEVGSNIKLGNAGVITATSFVGSGAALTGIDATAIKDSGGNVKIQAQASGAIHSGISTFQDIDVDGHTNLDNVSIAGITTGGGFKTAGTSSDGGATNGFTAGRINIYDNNSHNIFRMGTHPSYAPAVFNSSNIVFSTNGFYVRNTAATRNYIGINNSTGILQLGYGASSDYGYKLETSAKGIKVGTGVTIETNGQATFTGIITATSFSGDGSALTGITQTTINNNANNRIITGSGTANTLEGESTFTFDGTGVDINAGAGSHLQVDGSGSYLQVAGIKIWMGLNSRPHNTAIGNGAGANFSGGQDTTAVGHNALALATSGSANTAIGSHAMCQTVTGSNNVAVGHGSLNKITSGYSNSVLGRYAGLEMLGGYNNTLMGLEAGYNITSGNSNTAYGFKSLRTMSTNGGCVAVGSNALQACTGSDNVAMGAAAGQQVSTGTNNCLLGSSAGLSIQAGSHNVAIGRDALRLGSNSNVNYNVILGSNSVNQLTNAYNNVVIGYNCSGSGTMTGGTTWHSNVVIGYQAGNIVPSTASNIIIGKYTCGNAGSSHSNNIVMGETAGQYLGNNSNNIIAIGAEAAQYAGYGSGSNHAYSWSHSIAIGYRSFRNATGAPDAVVAVGPNTLREHNGDGDGSSGGYICAMGQSALATCQHMRHSVAIGNDSAAYWNPAKGNQHEGGSTFVGGGAGRYQGTATALIGIGRDSLNSSSSSPATGSNNTGIGARALEKLTSGSHNVCVSALYGALFVDTGSWNTFMGSLAGYGYDTNNSCRSGNYCTQIGGYTKSSGASNDYESCFGYGITGKGANTTHIRGNAYNSNNSSSWSTTSDERIKKNIVDNNIGLDAIEQIRVRNFEYRTKNEITDFDNTDAVVVEKEGVQLGVIAQEIKDILPDVVKQNTTGAYAVDPDNLTWYLVNAVKELSAEVKSLKAQLNS